MSISLPQNLASAQSPEDLQRMLGELVKVLEDYLNRRVDVFYRDNEHQPNPTMKKGDILVDAAIAAPEVALYEWDGTQLVPFTFPAGATGPTGPTGDTGPTGPTGATGVSVSGEPVSDGMLPNPEIVFDEATGDVVMSG